MILGKTTVWSRFEGKHMTTNVLYIDCCIRGEESRTRQLGEAFLFGLAIREAFTVERLTLMEEPLVPLTGDFFLQRERLLANGELSHPRFRYAHQFASADRIVIAAPFWDLSVPALLKIYIENVSVQGITFDVDDNAGLFGICRAEKMFFLTTRGGDYRESPLETGVPMMRNLATFFGIKEFDFVAADGLDLLIEPPEIILGRAIREAQDRAVVW
jgi:FMN-dependent NADH-azoreductase